MSGAPPLRPSLADLLTLLLAARAMEDAWGAALELCILTLGLPWEVVAIEIERIDWERGAVAVPSRGGGERILALSHDAQRAVLRISGSAGGEGQVVTAGRGPRLEAATFRLDRLLDRLAAASPSTIALPAWNLHGIREEAARLLAGEGAGPREIDAVLGRRPPNGRRALNAERKRSRATGGTSMRGDLALATLGAERWSRILGAERRRVDAEERSR